MKNEKPLGHKSYGSIPHLPGSRAGERDLQANSGMVRIATEKARDKHDTIIVQEKLDGSNCSVAKINGEIVPLGRAGYRAETSPYEQHRLFAWWVKKNRERFDAVLQEGERIVGEWLAQAHGTEYELHHEPYVVFDIMKGHNRTPYFEFNRKINDGWFIIPNLLHIGGSISIEDILKRLDRYSYNIHGAVGQKEGAVWRVERDWPTGKKGERVRVVDFLVKYVRPDKIDGRFLPEVSGGAPVWNWYPEGWKDENQF